MWVEVIGLPGVGKTTLIQKCRKEISAQYQVIESKHQNIVERIVTKMLSIFVYRSLLGKTKFAKKLSYRHGFRALRPSRKNIFFFDSGVCQLLIEHLIEEDFHNAEISLNAIEKAGFPDHIVYLKDDLQSVIEREMHRNPRRFDLSADEIQERYQKAQKWIENELLQKIAFVDTITPENNLDLIKVLDCEKTL